MVQNSHLVYTYSSFTSQLKNNSVVMIYLPLNFHLILFFLPFPYEENVIFKNILQNTVNAIGSVHNVISQPAII